MIGEFDEFDGGADECENCGACDVFLTDGYCEGCTCVNCGEHGTMDEFGMCSDVLYSYDECSRMRE